MHRRKRNNEVLVTVAQEVLDCMQDPITALSVVIFLRGLTLRHWLSQPNIARAVNTTCLHNSVLLAAITRFTFVY